MFIISVTTILIFLIFGLSLIFASLKNFNFKFSLSSFLFSIIGIYILFEASRYLIFLYKERENFEKIFIEFFWEKKYQIYITAIVSIILLFIYYFTAIYLKFNFILIIILYLPIFVLKNITFMVVNFLKNNNLEFLIFIINLTLPIAQIIYVYKITGLFLKIKKKVFK